jgi:hypothetical protein
LHAHSSTLASATGTHTRIFFTILNVSKLFSRILDAFFMPLILASSSNISLGVKTLPAIANSINGSSLLFLYASTILLLSFEIAICRISRCFSAIFDISLFSDSNPK